MKQRSEPFKTCRNVINVLKNPIVDENPDLLGPFWIEIFWVHYGRRLGSIQARGPISTLECARNLRLVTILDEKSPLSSLMKELELSDLCFKSWLFQWFLGFSGSFKLRVGDLDIEISKKKLLLLYKWPIVPNLCPLKKLFEKFFQKRYRLTLREGPCLRAI